jgi:ribosome biogenesis GTPase
MDDRADRFDLGVYGYTGPDLAPGRDYPEDSAPGRVIEYRRELYTVICPYGEVPAVLKGSFYHTLELGEDLPVVGDFVFLRHNPGGNSFITGRLPRFSQLSRSGFSGHGEGYVKNIREEVTAANFDYGFILSSLNREFNLNRIARFLTAMRRSGAFPVALLSKADLAEDPQAAVSAVQSIAPEMPVIPVSAKTGTGLRELEPFLAPRRTAIFLGSSGVGKSSLLNALAGEPLMEVRSIREDDAKGRHTTTHRQLFRLASGALVIDTPGMRELGLWDAAEGLSLVFAEVEELAARCRFSNCTHRTEPGCAIQAALEDGSLAKEVWRNYLVQKKEAAFVENHSAYLKQKREFHRAVARINRVRRKGDPGQFE